MPTKRRLSPETSAIIAAIENATGAAKIVADSVSKELTLHTQHDDERFEQLTKLVESIATDVKSLLQSRSFFRGAWKAASVAGGAVGGIVAIIALVVSWWKGWH